MTFNEFKDKKNLLKLTHKDFANLIGYSESAIKSWKTHGVPKWVDIVIDHLLVLNDMDKRIYKYKSHVLK